MNFMLLLTDTKFQENQKIIAKYLFENITNQSLNHLDQLISDPERQFNLK